MSDTVETDLTEPTEEPVDDIRSMVSAAFDAALQEPAEEPTAKPEAATSVDDRPRGPDGKFLPKDAAPQEPEAAATPAATEEKPKEEPAAVKVAEAPAHWSAADKAMLAKQPAEVQEYMLRRDKEMQADYTRKTQAIAEFTKEYDPIRQMFEPHRDAMRQRGLTPASLVQAWSNVEQGLMNGQGVGIIKGIVDGYRIDRAQLAQALGLAAPQAGDPPAPEGQNPPLPPEFIQRMNNIERWLQQEAAQREAIARQTQQEAAQRINSNISQFASATDKDGNLLHPHFAEVENYMAYLTQVMRASGREPDLAELYDQAVRANPSTFAKIIESERAAWEAQRAADEKKRQEEARAKAVAAQKAAKSVTGAPPSGQMPRRGEKSLREELEETASELAAA